MTAFPENISKMVYQQQVHITFLNILKEILAKNLPQFESIGNIFIILSNVLQDSENFKDILKEQKIDEYCFHIMEILKQV